MASTLLKVIVFVGAIVIGVGVTYFYSMLMPNTDLNTLILYGIAMVVFSYIALYFMTKGSNA